MRRLFLSLALALLGGAEAGNRLDVERVAFSPDGTRALVVEAGTLDGSGFGAARLWVLSTTTGAVLRRAQAQAEAPDPAPVVSRLLRQEAGVLRQHALNPARAARPVYARTFPVMAPVWAEGTGAGTTLIRPVRLWTVPVPVALRVQPLASGCRWRDLLPPGEGPAGFTLTVRDQVIHQDRTLPPERECAARYALDRVYVQGNRAVFIVRAYAPGFEGPNADVVPVAARLR